MRIKALLSLAALATCAVTVSAQVYSANIVGYYNVQVKASGQTLIANQFTTGGNTLNEVLPGATAGAVVKKFFNNDYVMDVFDGAAWLDAGSGEPSTATVAPGEGFFYEDTAGGSDYNLTFVGEVPLGEKSVNYPSGQTLVSTPNPQALELSAANGFPQMAGLVCKYFDNAISDYVMYVNDGTGWLDAGSGEPATVAPAVGQGYFIENVDPATYTWTRTYP